MKTPDASALTALRKAEILDPIIAGDSTFTGKADNAGKDGKAGNGGKAGKESVRSGGVPRKSKLTLTLDADLVGRIRAAYRAELADKPELSSLSQWASDYLLQAVNQVEATHNHGQPFIPVQTGVLRPGRSV
ncbi:hypothetical protein QP759_07215 [Actinomycetaceae bacterium UMB8039B]|uniref:hypothetical protein n=1 Tax=Pauljensenia sp. UMB8040A TaxID=3046343 RepID=UPI002551B467|nr:hypothetical protein [Pauljensenia sp. UMB8040A]MDK7780900.1 hypothetical protein [Actinomycetaceae bacterium UMB8041B]MDK8294296.1 hypothetical protein [Actinomycetaceae bacterium UMB8039B]MDK8608944.1 hypothetical protein [Actinomycetaceae bacterium UMB8041A]MDK8753212.1 hypothetical protein [Actinomycetaceae bacterium UMB8039A]MDK6829925.1 hypothetical protein [Pauljensenia sp. UMB8040A]